MLGTVNKKMDKRRPFSQSSQKDRHIQAWREGLLLTASTREEQETGRLDWWATGGGRGEKVILIFISMSILKISTYSFSGLNILQLY